MTKPIWKHVAPEIVPRLRLTFAAIALALAAIAGTGYFNLQKLNSSISNLTASTLTVFLKTEEAERHLKNLVIVLQQVNRATATAEIPPLEDEVRAGLEQLRAEVAGLENVAQVAPLTEGMALSLARIALGADLILTEKKNILDQMDNLASLEPSLRNVRDQLIVVLGELSYESVIIANNGFAASGRSNEEAQLLDIERSYSQELLRTSAIARITFETKSIVDKAIGLRGLATQADIAETADSIRFQLRTVTALLAQIEDKQARQNIAELIVRIRDHIFEPTGFISTVDDLLVAETALDAHIQRQSVPLSRISTLASQLTAHQRAAIDLANVDVNRRSDRLIWSLGGATLGALMTIAAATFYIVERQINRRMSKLTKAVLAIADGEKGYDVDVIGEDEIGAMAAALEVFKSNAEELVRSNKELERFAYIAAHDLRSPLRAIQDLADWITQDRESALSKDSKTYLSLLSNRVERLNNLLSDLLNYSRVGTEETVYDTVSVRSVVAETREMVDPSSRFDINFEGIVDDVVTVATPLRQTIQNLITNSIKHHDSPSGAISVSTKRIGRRLHCMVSDDGPGIEPQYHDRVFGLFQTLRSRDEVEGSGLGLAIVRKLIEHYGGDIRIESDPSRKRGTRIHFDFPIEEIHL